MIGSDTSPETIAMFRIDYDESYSAESVRYDGDKIGSSTCQSIAKELFITRYIQYESKNIVQFKGHYIN